MRTPAKVEYMILPRLAALSEVLWTNKATKNWDDFLKRMPELQKRLDLMQVNYNRKSFVRGK